MDEQPIAGILSATINPKRPGAGLHTEDVCEGELLGPHLDHATIRIHAEQHREGHKDDLQDRPHRKEQHTPENNPRSGGAKDGLHDPQRPGESNESHHKAVPAQKVVRLLQNDHRG